MFKHTVLSASLLALSSSVMGKPINTRRGGFSLGGDITPIISIDGQSFDVQAVSVKEFSSTHSFDSFGGLQSLSGFDNFFGEGHFCSASSVQVFSEEQIVTCHATEITVIQQQLSIVAEYAKRVILTQSCETETQVIAFSQWLAGLVSWGEDLRRVSERHVSFDASIASQISSVVDSHGNINIGDFGFSGSEIGSHSVTVIGGNWNDQTSPISVGLAWDSCVAAAGPISISSCEVCSSSSSSTVSLPPVISSGCSGHDCGSSSLPPIISGCPPGLDCTLPPVVSSGCSGSDCGSSLPPVIVSGCPSGDCGGVSSLPPVVSSGCSGSDCGSVSLPPLSGCPSGDCGGVSSLPPVVSSGCSGADCGTVSLPPLSGCPSGDCGGVSSLPPPVDSGCPSGDCDSLPPAATLPGSPLETLPGAPAETDSAPAETLPGAPLETGAPEAVDGTATILSAPPVDTASDAAAPTDISVALGDPAATDAAATDAAATPLPTLVATIASGAGAEASAPAARRRGIFKQGRLLA